MMLWEELYILRNAQHRLALKHQAQRTKGAEAPSGGGVGSLVHRAWLC